MPTFHKFSFFWTNRDNSENSSGFRCEERMYIRFNGIWNVPGDFSWTVSIKSWLKGFMLLRKHQNPNKWLSWGLFVMGTYSLVLFWSVFHSWIAIIMLILEDSAFTVELCNTFNNDANSNYKPECMHSRNKWIMYRMIPRRCFLKKQYMHF